MNDNIKKLYDVLSSKGYYTKSFEDFNSQWSDEEYRKKVYGVVSRDGLYTKDYSSFVSKYSAPSEPIKKKEPTASPSQSAQEPSSSATQPKKTQPRSVSSSVEGGELFTGYPGKGDKKYLRRDGKWYEELNVGGNIAWQPIDDKGRTSNLNEFFVYKPEKVFTGYPGKEKNKYRVINGIWQRQQDGQSNWQDVRNEGSINALNKQFGQNVQYSKAKDLYGGVVEDKREIAKKELDKKLSKINSAFIGQEEGQVTDILSKAFPDFKFVKSGIMRDEMEVYAPNGEKITISLDNFRDASDIANASSLRNFIRTNAVVTDKDKAEQKLREAEKVRSQFDLKPFNPQITLGEGYGDENIVTDPSQFKTEETPSTDIMTADMNVKKARQEYMSKVSDNFVELYDRKKAAMASGDAQAISDVNAEYAQLSHDVQASRDAGNYFNDISAKAKENAKATKEFNAWVGSINAKLQNGEITQDEYDAEYVPKIKEGAEFLKSKANELKTEYGTASNVTKSIEEATAKNYIIQEAKGSVIGGIAYSAVDGLTDVARLATMGKLSKQAQEDIVRAVVGQGTTKEFMESEERSDISRVLFSLSQSLAQGGLGGLAKSAVMKTGASALVGTAAQTVPFYAASYYEMRDQFDSPEFEGISETQKVLFSTVYGLASGVLERYGLTKSMSKTPLGKNITNNIIKTAFKDIPKDASREIIEQAIESSIKKQLVAAGVNTVGAMVVEGSTEMAQSLTQTGLQEAFDAVNKVNLFDNGTFGDIFMRSLEEGYLGALGGGIMNTVTNAASIVGSGISKALNKDQLAALDNITKIDGITESFDAYLKGKVVSGDITPQEAKELSDSFRETKAGFDKMPDGIPSEDKAKAFDLMVERSKIEKEIAGKEDNLVVSQKARIAEINNELQTISQNAVQEQTTSEVPVQPESEVSGEVAQGKPEAEPQVVTEEGQQEEVAQQPVAQVKPTLRQAINRPATFSEYGGSTFESPLRGNVYVDGQQVVFEERSTGRVYELGNVNDVIDSPLPGVSVEQERVSITPEGKVSIDGNNWNIQSELPTQGIEYNPAGEVMRVSLKDDSGKTTMFEGQDAVDIAYQIELQKYQTPEQQQYINELLEQDEEFKQATANVKPAETTAVVQEEAATDTAQATEEEIDDEVSRLEELLGKKTPKFQKGETGTVSEEDVDKVAEEMNSMPEEIANFDVPSDLTTKNKMNVKSLVSRFGEKLKSAWRGGVIKDVSEFNGIPFIFTISDQLSSGAVKNPFTGNTIDLNGGIAFGLTDGNEENAWANTDAKSSDDMYKRAVSVYNKNKELFDRLWAEGKLPNGHVPMAVVKMGSESIKTNEALFRVASDTIKSKFSKRERAASLKGLIEDIGFAAVRQENERRKSNGNPELTKSEEKKVYNQAINDSKVVAFIRKNEFKTIDELLDNMNSMKPIGERSVVTQFLFTGGVEFDKTTKPGIPRSRAGVALVGDKGSEFYKYIHLQTLNNIIQEEATSKIPPNHVIAITGVDVLNGGPTSASKGQVVHRNYPFGVKGMLIGVLESPVNAADVFPEMNSKIFAMMKPSKSGKLPSTDTAVSQAVAVSGSIVTTKAFVGARLSSKMTNLQKLAAKLKLAFPSVTVVDTQEEFERALQDPNVKQFVKNGEVVYGFTSDGKVFLNPEKANANTAIHEFSHIWMAFLRENNPALLKKGFQLLEGTSILKKKIEEFGDTELAREEAMAELIANRGETIIEAGIKSKFKNWLNAAFNYIKSKFTAFDKLTPEEFQKISLNEFVDGSLSVLMGGKEITSKEVKSLQVMFSKANKIDDIISIARDNGFSDAAIKKYLEKSGFDQKDINAAMKQRKAPSVSKILGKPAPKKVTVNEAAALKDQLKLEARAARQSKLDLKQKQRQLVTIINQMKRGGILTVQQASALAKRVVMTNVDKPIMVERMLQYADRLFERADYQERLREARKVKARVNKLRKSGDAAAHTVALGKLLSKIDPALVEDIDLFIDVANEIKDALEPSRVVGEAASIRLSARISKISDYAKAEIKRQEDILKQEKLSEYEDLVEAKIISDKMTLKEIKAIISEINNPSIDPDVRAQKEESVRNYVESVINDHLDNINFLLENNIDPSGMKEEMTDRQKELIREMLRIDISQIGVRDLMKMSELMDNFVKNGIVDGIEEFTKSNIGKENAVEVENNGVKARSMHTLGNKTKWIEEKIGADGREISNGRFWGQQMMTFKVLNDFMFKGVGTARRVLDKMGFTDFENGVAKAVRMWNDILDRYTDKFHKTKPNGRDFNDAYNIYERGMYAALKRTVIGSQYDVDAEMRRMVNIINESIRRLAKDGDPKQKKMAELYAEIAEKLGINDPNITISEIESRMDKINSDAVNWWIDEWSKHYSDLADISESVYNTILGQDMFYTPYGYAKIKGTSMTMDEILNDNSGAFAATLDYVYDDKSGSLKEAVRPNGMADGRYLNLDFDTVNSKALKAALIDINTAAATRQIKGFLSSDSWKNIIEDGHDRDMYEAKLKAYIFRSRNRMPGVQDKESALEFLSRVSNMVGFFGTARALAQTTQSIKQTVPLILSTMFNTRGTIKILNPFADKAAYDFIHNSGYSIANRGQESATSIETAHKAFDKTSKGFVGGAKKAFKFIEGANQMWLKMFLSQPDVWIAKSAWLSYYKQSLRRQGVDTKNIDWSTHKLNREAGNYAQHMVDRQQFVSDVNLAGELFVSEKPGTRILRNILMPFASFSTNQKSRVFADLSTLSSGSASKQDQRDAGWSLAGLGVEMFTMFSIRYYIAIGMLELAKQAMGVDLDDEDEEKMKERALKNASKQAVLDILSPNASADYFMIEGMNKIISWWSEPNQDEINAAIKAENELREKEGNEPLSGEMKDTFIEKFIKSEVDENLIWNDNGINMGVYSIMSDNMREFERLVKIVNTGVYEKEFGGIKTEKFLMPEDRKPFKVLLPFVGASMAGFLPGDPVSLYRSMLKVADKKAISASKRKTFEAIKGDDNKVSEVEKFLMDKFKTSETATAAEKIIEEMDWIESNGGLNNERQVKKYIEIYETDGSVGIRDMQEIQKLK